MERVSRAGRRESPPGVADEMDDAECSAMMGGSRVSGETSYDDRSSNSEEPSDDDDNTRVGADPRSPSETNIDNPPVRAGDNATTIGFEFEFMSAVSRFDEDFPDPHPNDTRWLSDHLVDREEDSAAFKYTVRNKIIDELTENGVCAHKTNELWETLRDSFDWWDSLEYENPNKNDDAVLSWMGTYKWRGSETEDENVCEAVRSLTEQFVQHHLDNKLELYMTRGGIIHSVRDSVTYMIEGESSRRGRLRVMTLWYESVNRLLRDEKKKYYAAKREDPDRVINMGDVPQYLAWSATEDLSITEHDDVLISDSYTLPEGVLPVDPRSNTPYGDPPDLYKWVGSEVISPVLDYDNPKTRLTLRLVCKALRDALRIHKPIVQVPSGVHIHIGQQAGWTLLHLKKFATLWHMVEPFMYKLHRRDRLNSTWCGPTARESRIATYIRTREDALRSFVATTTGPKKLLYDRQMSRYVPAPPSNNLRELFKNIWHYESISDLNKAMGSSAFQPSCVRWRILGDLLSLEPGEDTPIQTLEFRLMQGTLDADHIWRWAGILERLVTFARDSTAEVFRGAIRGLRDEFPPPSLRINQEDLDWFRLRRTDRDYFAYPDPNGRVDWTDPFMVRGYGETHGSTAG
ncbi:hypothetical protein F4802DRAFT_564983 [Xylaria palmicola]|nr:hypothetical protein F4802DRAFT_564983 [Xylaria palmicola]